MIKTHRASCAGEPCFTPNRVDFTSKRPFAWGSSYQSGQYAVYIDGNWGHLSMSVHRVPVHAELRVWKHNGECAAPEDALTFKPNYMTCDDDGLAITQVYLRPAQVQQLGLKPGDKLAFQPAQNGRATSDPIQVPVHSEKQVYPPPASGRG